jgi:glutamate synthase (NADPH/NADH) large chain
MASKPGIKHLLIDTEGVEIQKKELMLFLSRKIIEKECGDVSYIASLSSKTVVYKGLLVATNLELFYPDLAREDFESAFCMFHQRFSTNTLPDWTLSQPMRVLAHNGEINTIQGNRNIMASYEHEARHEVFGDAMDAVRPFISSEESDSASLDKVIELLILSGFSPEHAVNMCIPPAWENSSLSKEIKAFFEYQSLLMKPWDGPAAVTLTDGNTICAHLDRNGLRPLRYSVTSDGLLILGSETGMIDLEGREIIEKGRLGPGDTLSVDINRGRIKCTDEILQELAGQRPYRKWLETSLTRLKENDIPLSQPDPDLRRKQIAFGYTSEEIDQIIKTTAETAKVLIYSMGDDTPLPPLSEKPQLLFRYFKQRFSQVTNPPIASIRERMVMSLKMNMGYKRNFLLESPEHARRLHLDSPLLSDSSITEIMRQKIFTVEKIPMTFDRASPLRAAVNNLQDEVCMAVERGGEIIILSDRDVSKDRIAIPSLLAVSASFKSLQKNKLANRASIIIETGEARDVHHFACLIGYGTSAVHPYLAHHTIRDQCERGDIRLSYEEAVRNFKKAAEDELLKVIARMGISTLNSYYGAQLFDSICLNRDFVEEFFTGTPVVIEADGLNEVEESLLKRHAAAFDSHEPVLDYGGNLRHRKGEEWHAWSLSSVAAFQKFIKTGDTSFYKEFSGNANGRPVYPRHLLSFKKGEPLPVEQVEPEEHILRRFVSGAMSVGSLSPEAHETIAEACNRLGIKSNSGEGGEDPLRYWGIKNSAIKQIASGRFGVTPVYLASARDLEIKIAQGAKPGEGGHLPAIKVTEYIASLRHCSPNTLLISPPPHHDIYSIEDLAQLIHDLKEANPGAHICVKLVSETGVGTIAAGVAKAYADIVQISGCEGGTGAASISSIKNAGNYWETGLSETQRVLMENGLREKIRLRVDGGIRTGRDIIIAALLGAEEFGFGTATMVAAGCIMARKCHLNTCPTGIATQDEELRKRFRGRPEAVMAYFRAVSHEVREILADMGFRKLEDIIGRTDLLTVVVPDDYPAAKRIKFNGILDAYPANSSRINLFERNDNPAPSMNDTILKDLLPYIEDAEPVEKEYRIRNIHRSIPVKLSYHVAVKYRENGLPPDTIKLTFSGTAGQSFGAFNHRGISLTLIGDANDYVGKGMFGGRIVIIPSNPVNPDMNVIMGNTVLYGATGGELYASGSAGERFAVRNSGATAVVEGTGHHVCEYMTGGTVVVLGKVGYNVGAGMTGGSIYIYDEKNNLKNMLNSSYVKCTHIEKEEDARKLRTLLEKHYSYTKSLRAGEILDAFDRAIKHFCNVSPL